jgi:hypothetical protein
MVRHDAVRKNCDVHSADSIFEQLLERGVIAGSMKKNRTFGRSIENVENKAWRAFAAPSHHSHPAKAIVVPKGGGPSVL